MKKILLLCVLLTGCVSSFSDAVRVLAPVFWYHDTVWFWSPDSSYFGFTQIDSMHIHALRTDCSSELTDDCFYEPIPGIVHRWDGDIGKLNTCLKAYGYYLSKDTDSTYVLSRYYFNFFY